MMPLFLFSVLIALLQLSPIALTATLLLPSKPASVLHLPAFNSSFGTNVSVSNLRDFLPPDPYQKRVPGTTTSLIFSQFRNDPSLIEPVDLLAVGYRAQYEIVKSVVANGGDGPIAQPNFEWKNNWTFLRMGHLLEDKLTWLMLAQAVHGAMDWGYSIAMITTQITILDDDAGVVGSGSLTVEVPPHGTSTE